MSILLFFIILSVLVVVHELGHFAVARFFGIRVDEFGLGYPPRAKKLFVWRGTVFTLNWLPFGGFVRIFGENPAEEHEVSEREGNFQYKNRGIQAAVLVAGVVCNALFAWMLIAAGFMGGLPSPVGAGLPLENARTVITLVVPGSPADTAGLKAGDAILTLSRGANITPSAASSTVLTPEEAAAYISRESVPVLFRIMRGGEPLSIIVAPKGGIIADRPAVGIAMETVGTAKLSFLNAIKEGGRVTWALLAGTARALGEFISQALTGRANLSAVTGPVGLAGMVGDAQALGWGYLITFTALISINLAVLNLMPFPALDGGRLVFVALEAVFRRRIPAAVFNAINTAGFAVLIFLMILVTFRDVRAIL